MTVKNVQCVLLVCLMLCQVGMAQESQKLRKPLRVDPENTPLELSLRKCIALALAHNLDIQVEAYNPLINKQDIIGTRALFDLSFFSNASWGEATTQTGIIDPVSTQTESRTIHTDFGVRKSTIVGTTYQISLFLDKNRSTPASSVPNPSWRTGVEFSLTQPLLRGLGPAFNTADILIAQNSRDSSVYLFQQTVIQVVTDVELRYWDLVFAREDLRVKQKSLELSRDLLKITKAKVEAGDLAQIDILQSETNVSLREEAIIVAENAVRDAEDRLKNLIKPLDEKLLWKTELLPTEPMGTLESLSKFASAYGLQQAIKTAISRRPELLQQRTSINSTHLAMVKAQNQLWPKLDVTGSLRFNGLGQNFNESSEEVAQWHFFDWSLGLAFEYPLGNRAARSSYRRSRLSHAQAKLSLKRAERNIIISVRQAHRQIASTLKRIRASQKSVSLARRQLDAERKKFDVGLSTLFRVNEFIEDLIQAGTNAIKAKVDYLQALTRMRQAESTTMERLASQKILIWPHPKR